MLDVAYLTFYSRFKQLALVLHLLEANISCFMMRKENMCLIQNGNARIKKVWESEIFPDTFLLHCSAHPCVLLERTGCAPCSRGITVYSLTSTNARQELGLDLSYFTNMAAMLLPPGKGTKIYHEKRPNLGVGDVRTSAFRKTVKRSDR